MDDVSWKKGLWEFFATALVFWIGRDSKKPEKIGVVAVTIFVVLIVVFG